MSTFEGTEYQHPHGMPRPDAKSPYEAELVSYILSTAMGDIDNIGDTDFSWDATKEQMQEEKDRMVAYDFAHSIELPGSDDLDDDLETWIEWGANPREYSAFLPLEDSLDNYENISLTINFSDSRMHTSWGRNLYDLLWLAHHPLFHSRYEVTQKSGEAKGLTGIQIIDTTTDDEMVARAEIDAVKSALDSFVPVYGLHPTTINDQDNWSQKLHVIIVDKVKPFTSRNSDTDNTRAMCAKTATDTNVIMIEKSLIAQPMMPSILDHELGHFFDNLTIDDEGNQLSDEINMRALLKEHGEELFSNYGLTNKVEMLAELFQSNRQGIILDNTYGGGARYYRHGDKLNLEEFLLRSILGSHEIEDPARKIARHDLLKKILEKAYPGIVRDMKPQVEAPARRTKRKK